MVKPISASRVERLVSHLQDAYDYTLSSPSCILSQAQRDFYETNGYLVIPNLVSSAALDRYKTRLREICHGLHRSPTMTIMRDISQKSKACLGELNVTKLQDFQDDPILFEYCSNESILSYVKSFIGPNVLACHTMCIQKPPQIGETGDHPKHQDLYYFPFRPANHIVCSWTAMERVDQENGCLFVYPGSHLSPLLPHGYPENKVNKAYHGIKTKVPDQWSKVALPMEAGDTVFFHPLLIHGSGWNQSKTNYRRAISCHYASSDCYFIPVKGTIQEELAQEVEQMAKKRLPKGMEIEYNDIWRLKSRLVCGRDGAFSQD